MAIYRGAGGASDSVDDATVNAVAAYAAAAANSATDSADSAAEAAVSAAAASGSVASVATYASNAATSASNAASSASLAAVSSTEAEGFADAASASAVAAAASASDASNSASNADTSEANAASSASSASTSASNAASSAASALAIYGNTTAMNNAVAAAANSASNAATSASNASTSASTATTQASNALSSANAADISEAAALAYSNNAATSANNALNSQAAAAASAVSAATSAASASTSATNSASIYGGLSAVNAAVATTTTNANNAATSATNAANSATQAAASAASASAIVLGVSSELPSIRPSLNLDFANSATVDPRITFTRASTATYYDGKTTAKAEENLLLQSQTFETTWVKSLVTVTANSTTAPDGTTTADTVTASAVADYHSVNQGMSLINGLPYQISFFAKANGYTKVAIADLFSGRVAVYFDLAAATVIGTAGAGYVSSSITSVGNGWYRCVIGFTAGSAGFSISAVGYPDTGTTLTVYGAQYTGDGTSGIYIWGAQAEQRSSVTAYTPTTTAPITNYIPVLQTAASGVPRLDYDPVTFEAKGLLIEEQRTNLLTYSSDFSNAIWTKSNTTITSNITISPDGTLTGDKLIEDSAAAPHYTSQAFTATSAAVYTQSIYVKAGERTRFLMLFAGGFSSTPSVDFNLTTGTVAVAPSGNSSSASITSVGNGWYRCTLTATASSTASSTARFYNLDATGTASYTGNGYSGVYIWGAQLEAGSFATSYIPTTSAQVTRAADSAIMTGTNFSSWYRQDEGTLYADITAFKTSATYGNIFGSGSNNAQGLFATATTVLCGANPFAIVNVTTSSPFKAAGGYASSGVSLYANGVNIASAGAQPVNSPSSFSIMGAWSSQTGNGWVKKLAYYPKRLTNTELQALTA